LGYALSTSIIGWFAGYEISGNREFGSGVNCELESFADTVRVIHGQFQKVMKEQITGYEILHARQFEALKAAIDVSEKISRLLIPVHKKIDEVLGGSLVESLSEIQKRSKGAADEIARMEESASQVADYLSESRVLIDQLEKLMDLITARKSLY
jgi:hypothetical protein